MEKGFKTITADCEYFTCRLYGAFIELELSEDEYNEFNKLSETDKLQYIIDEGILVTSNIDLSDLDNVRYDISNYDEY